MWSLKRGFLKDRVYWWRKECILWEVGGLPFFTIGSLSLLLFSSIVICSANSDNDSSIVWLPRRLRDSLLLNLFILSNWMWFKKFLRNCQSYHHSDQSAAILQEKITIHGRQQVWGPRPEPRQSEAVCRLKEALLTPTETGCRSGSQWPADLRGLRGTGLHRSHHLPVHAEGLSLQEGPHVPHVLPSPPDNMAFKLRGHAGHALIPFEEQSRSQAAWEVLKPSWGCLARRGLLLFWCQIMRSWGHWGQPLLLTACASLSHSEAADWCHHLSPLGWQGWGTFRNNGARSFLQDLLF